MQHAPFGSSTAERVMNCPGSVALNAKSPEQPPSEYAAKGSAQHALIEHLLMEGGEPEDFIGAAFVGVEIDEELASGVSTALKAAEELLADHHRDVFDLLGGGLVHVVHVRTLCCAVHVGGLLLERRDDLRKRHAEPGVQPFA